MIDDLQECWQLLRPNRPTFGEGLIARFLKESAAKDRECMICGQSYKGFRDICGARGCELEMMVRVEENRRMRPIDYVSTGRKTFLVEELPVEFEQLSPRELLGEEG